MTTALYVSELISWGHQTGGDFDEALRLYCEHDPDVQDEVNTLTTAEYQSLNDAFNDEFGNVPDYGENEIGRVAPTDAYFFA